MLLAGVAAVLLVGCGPRSGASTAGSTAAAPTSVPPSVPTSVQTSGTASRPVSPTTATTTPPAASPTSMRVPERGTGRLVPVPGSAAAPGQGRELRVRVEVEGGVDVEPAVFAAEVLRTLNDDRSWGHGGNRSFARTSGPADVVVVLASPTTSARLCRPLVTHGRLSCRRGDRAVLTSYRWAKGTPEFDSVAQYRRYVVNHEVGHVLGHGHEYCPGPGRAAPVMQQQTKQVAPCRPNPWPFP